MIPWEKYRSLLGELHASKVEVKRLTELVESQRLTIVTRDRAISRLEAKFQSFAKRRPAELGNIAAKIVLKLTHCTNLTNFR